MQPSLNYMKANRLTARDNYIVFDIETVARDGVDAFIGEPEAPGNIKDPIKIAAAIEEKRHKQRDKLGLDMNLNRIVALGMKLPTMSTPIVNICRDEDEERLALDILWTYFHPSISVKSPLIGFHCKTFDVPVCVRRTQLLGMPAPLLDTNKYSKDIIDLVDVLSFGIYQESGVMPRRLKSYCDLFGVTEYDDCDGADIQELVVKGNWDNITKHCAADVMRTEELALKLGVI